MKLTCADSACDRAPMRERDGQRWCMYHPEQPAPDMDMLSGRLRGPDGKPKPQPVRSNSARRRQAPKPAAVPTPRRRSARPAATVGLPVESRPSPAEVEEAYEQAADRVLQAELEDLERTDPVVAAAAASYDAAVDRILTRPAPPAPRRGRPPSPVDAAEAARRYQDGEGLQALAADLHVGVPRLREILVGHGVKIRSRGDVLGQRGPLPRPIDEDECERLYREGLNSHEVARRLRVRQARVIAVLRSRGVLRAQPGSPRPLDSDEARRLYATGLTIGEVARMLGVRASRVSEVLHEAGELRRRSPRQVVA